MQYDPKDNGVGQAANHFVSELNLMEYVLNAVKSKLVILFTSNPDFSPAEGS